MLVQEDPGLGFLNPLRETPPSWLTWCLPSEEMSQTSRGLRWAVTFLITMRKQEFERDDSSYLLPQAQGGRPGSPTMGLLYPAGLPATSCHLPGMTSLRRGLLSWGLLHAVTPEITEHGSGGHRMIPHYTGVHDV